MAIQAFAMSASPGQPVEALAEAQLVQTARKSGKNCSTELPTPSQTAANASRSSTVEYDVSETLGTSDVPFDDPRDPDSDEVFHDLSPVSSAPYQQPVHAQCQFDEADSLLNMKLELDQQNGLFAGVGFVEPLCARLDVSSRRLRRVGKLPLRELKTIHEHQVTRRLTEYTKPQSLRTLPTVMELQKVNDNPANEQMTVPKPEAITSCTQGFNKPQIKMPNPNGILRPISFAPYRFSITRGKRNADTSRMIGEEMAV